ncbi:kinase-like domain-containing protein [Tanacetum coccineum]
MLIVLARLTTSSKADESDISCLRSIKEHLEDPLQMLSTWKFDYISEGSVCGFTGVKCWNGQQNRVLSIQLANMRLRGSVANNRLSGPLPILSDATFPAESYVNNLGLCGDLDMCMTRPSQKNRKLPLSEGDQRHIIESEFHGYVKTVLERLTISNWYLTMVLSLVSQVPPTSTPPTIKESLAKLADNIDKLELIVKRLTASTASLVSITSQTTFTKNESNDHNSHNKTDIPETTTDHVILVANEAGIKKRKVNSSIPLSITCNDVFNAKVTSMEKFIRRLSLAELKMATNNFDNKKRNWIRKYGNNVQSYVSKQLATCNQEAP